MADIDQFHIMGGKVTVDQAAWMANKSNQAIYNSIKDGRMTAEIQERNGKTVKVVQIVDLERLYQNLRYPGKKITDENGGPVSRTDTQHIGGGLTGLQQFDKFLEIIEKRFKDQLTQYEDEVDYLRKANEKSQETVHKVTMLLEDRSKSEAIKKDEETSQQAAADKMSQLIESFKEEKTQQEKKLEALETTIEELKKQNRRVLFELQKKNQGFFGRLFSSNQKTAKA